MSRTTSICVVVLIMLMVAACGTTSEATATDCKTYVAETRDACLDMILRGLDVSCSKQLTVIGTVAAQADGSLFDVGDDKQNQAVADSVCSSYIGDLRKARAAKDAAMLPASEAAPQCTALAKQVDAHCLSTLGEAPLTNDCKSALGMMSMDGLPREQRCELAAGMLLKK